MIATKLAFEALSKEAIPELLESAGPCVTLLLPAHRPGEPGEPAALVKADLEEAERKLAARKVHGAAAAHLLDPLRELANDCNPREGATAPRAIFRSSQLLRQFDLPPGPSQARLCVVGDCFYLRRILAQLEAPAVIDVLEITKKTATLLACGSSGVDPVALPSGTPRTLEEFTGFDPPDHDLRNRSAAGPSSGAMRGVQFGTGSEREKQHGHLHDFYRAVDRGLNALLFSQQTPLILAGVEEDLAIYRSVSTYPNLLDQTIHGSPTGRAKAELAREARIVALSDSHKRAAAALAKAAEQFGPGRFSTDLDAILRAAVQGRVIDLYIDENSRRLGDFDGKAVGGRNFWHAEDLLNVAAVETLRYGGQVHTLPVHWISNRALIVNGAAATCRF